MATFTKRKTGWKTDVRRKGWLTVSKTFRLKSDAEDWARGIEDEMQRGGYIDRRPAAAMILNDALDLYLSEVTLTKGSSARSDREPGRTKALREALGEYALAAITPKLVSQIA